MIIIMKVLFMLVDGEPFIGVSYIRLVLRIIL